MYSEEDLQRVRNVSVLDVINYFGYGLKRMGKCYTTEKHDSMLIYPATNTWSRMSQESGKIKQGRAGKVGGSVIDFLTEMEGYTFKDAIEFLSDFENLNIEPVPYVKEEYQPKTELILPEKEPGSYRRLYAYLLKTRCIRKKVVDYFVKNHLIYETKDTHNIAFLGMNASGEVKSVNMRGTYDIEGKKPFKIGDEANDKFCGFSYTAPNKSNNLLVVEGPIDLLSYISLTDDWDNNIVSLNCASENAMVGYVKEHPHIENIELALDNDAAGWSVMRRVMNEYLDMGVNIRLCEVCPVKYNDMNEYLKAVVAQNREKARKLQGR